MCCPVCCCMWSSRRADGAGVCGLTAARRVEGRAVERDDRAPGGGGRDRRDAGFELGQVRVRVVEPFGSHLAQQSTTAPPLFLRPGGTDFFTPGLKHYR